MNIFLTGFMGSGKSYWGRVWAATCGRQFYDLDAVIEMQQQKTIAGIFEKNGEAYFRSLETAALHDIAGRSNCIIACGGGTPCFNNNMEWMNAHGITVHLSATPQQIIHRVLGEQDKRPLIKGMSKQQLETFITGKLEERNPFYRQAQYVLPVDSLTPATINSIIKKA